MDTCVAYAAATVHNLRGGNGDHLNIRVVGVDNAIGNAGPPSGIALSIQVNE
jgi:hypothetical protein